MRCSLHHQPVCLICACVCWRQRARLRLCGAMRGGRHRFGGRRTRRSPGYLARLSCYRRNGASGGTTHPPSSRKLPVKQLDVDLAAASVPATRSRHCLYLCFLQKPSSCCPAPVHCLVVNLTRSKRKKSQVGVVGETNVGRDTSAMLFRVLPGAQLDLASYNEQPAAAPQSSFPRGANGLCPDYGKAWMTCTPVGASFCQCQRTARAQPADDVSPEWVIV